MPNDDFNLLAAARQAEILETARNAADGKSKIH